MHVIVKRPAGERYPTPKLTGLTACLNYRAFAYALCYLSCGPEDQNDRYLSRGPEDQMAVIADDWR
jgi:hypothetical protein